MATPTSGSSAAAQATTAHRRAVQWVTSMTKEETMTLVRSGGAILLLMVSGGVGYLWRSQDELRTTAAEHAARLAVHDERVQRVATIPGDFERKLEALAQLVRNVDGKVSVMDTRLARVETKLDNR